MPNPTGLIGWGRFNHLHPPFDNPAIRRALMGAVSQEDYMTAVTGTDRSLWRDNVGFFPPETPLASDAGLDVLKGPRDFDKVKRDLAAAGYKGEKVVLLAATDFPTLNALGQVGNDMLRRAGMNVEFVATDWGSVVARRSSREPPEKGGWSIFFTFWTGLDVINPGVNQPLRGNGKDGWWGWSTSPRHGGAAAALVRRARPARRRRRWHGRCRRWPSRRRRPCRSASISRPRHSGAASATCRRACRCSGA